MGLIRRNKATRSTKAQFGVYNQRAGAPTTVPQWLQAYPRYTCQDCMVDSKATPSRKYYRERAKRLGL